MPALQSAERSRKARAEVPAAEPVAAQVQVQVQVVRAAQVQVVRAAQVPEPAAARVMVAARALVREAPEAAAASPMWSVADRALPALRACAMKPLHDPTAQRGAKA
ncbi:hypothetical protein [Bradyrhizobium sp. USDA 241]|uniref:hypothetical protein n=1 Tax=Bradyrhizobium sp. USDA 241 TaxID=3377725 RepID=UPI003C787DA8